MLRLSIVVIKRFTFGWLIFLFFAACTGNQTNQGARLASQSPLPVPKEEYLRFAIVADSHNDNDRLKQALAKAKGLGVLYVVGLGDFSEVGTLEELVSAKDIFDSSGLLYFVIPGDHDLWQSRQQNQDPTANFMKVFGVAIEPALETSYDFGYKRVTHIMLDNSDLYKGIENDWEWLKKVLNQNNPASGSQERYLPTFLFVHQPLDHPYLDHLMGRLSTEVDEQRKRLLQLIGQSFVAEVFAGDVHQFNRFTEQTYDVKMTTVGAIAAARNPERPSFVLVTVFTDGTYEVEKIEI